MANKRLERAKSAQTKQSISERKAQIKEDASAKLNEMKESAGEKLDESKNQLNTVKAQTKEKMNEIGGEAKATYLEETGRIRATRLMLQEEAKQKQIQFREGAKEMSSKLKNLIAADIDAMKKKEKTRGAQIVAIFAKHNFYAGGFTPVELRTTLEDLGPTYVKIGQIMSSRVDMLPEEYCKELEKLRQTVKPLDSEVARAVIEQETGKPLGETFSYFNDKPIGSASIGQAHGATLLDGTRVVVKVQRPLIADMMRQDFVLLKKLAAGLNTINEGNEDSSDAIDLLSVIEELEKVTDEELDFRVEAANHLFFKEHCIQDETLVTCPVIYPELTTERMETMSFVDGYSVAKKDRLIEDGYDPDEIGRRIVDNYLHQVLDVGVFHGDPHQGNIMVSHGVPTWIDFGMIGRLSEANIKNIQNLILSIIEMDTEGMANTVLSMGAGSARTDRGRLVEELDALINKYMSVTSLEELDIAALLEDLTELMANNYIKVPGEYTMLIRSIATIEGVLEQLCQGVNLFEMITNKLMDRVKKSFDVQEALLGAGKDLLAAGKKASKIPSLASDVLNSITKGRAKINLEFTGYAELVNSLNDIVRNVILAAFSCVLFFGSCILCMTDIKPATSDGMPIVAVIGFIFSIALAIYTVKKMKTKK